MPRCLAARRVLGSRSWRPRGPEEPKSEAPDDGGAWDWGRFLDDALTAGLTAEQFWRATPGEVGRAIRAYGRRQKDGLDLLYMAGWVSAGWNSQAVWGARRDPSLSSMLGQADPGEEGIESRLSDEGKRQYEVFCFMRDEARFKAQNMRFASSG